MKDGAELHDKVLNGTSPQIIYVDEKIPVASNIEVAVEFLNQEALKEHNRLMAEDEEYRVQFERMIEEKRKSAKPLTRVQKRKLQREKVKIQGKIKRYETND